MIALFTALAMLVCPAASNPLEITATADGGVIFNGGTIKVKAYAEGWKTLDYRKDIVPGSALDFSVMNFLDAPAGKHGWVKAVGGHFEFGDLPGVEQRFYGVNLCFSANYPTHEMADVLVDRLALMGYNTIRIHHHDRDWEKDDNADRLDYLVAAAIRKGFYFTTDMYVSRNVSWKEIGIDRKGLMDKNLFKAYVGCHDASFRNWCEFSRKFMEHKNPYTGRAMKDEPGLALISFINEGKLGMHWADKKNDPVILEAWKDHAGDKPLPAYGKQEFWEFESYLNRVVFEKCRDYLESIGCKALFTNDNNGSGHADMQDESALYDYVDNHFYVDHPQFLTARWKLPARCNNTNPVYGGGPKIFSKGYAKGCSKPYTITEWNFSGPGRYRGMGGIMTGALASIQNWDGLWRFSYAHNRDYFEYSPEFGPGYFDCSTDPLTMASDKASVLLFLRRDVQDEKSLIMDKDSGSMKLISDRTCGIFSMGGSEEAGALRADISGVPATVWVSSLEGRKLIESGRMLLTHLTDVQGNGTEYADDTRTVLLKWGKGTLVETGQARISLTLDSPGSYSVYELDTSGRRVRKLKSSAGNGSLNFTVSTDGPSGGRIFYEITK